MTRSLAKIGESIPTLPEAATQEPTTRSEPTQLDPQERIVRRLLAASFPERQASMPAPRLYGQQWKAKGSSIAQRFGDGFLIALLGESGTGKTQMAVSLAAIYRGTVRYTKALRFFLELHAARNNARGDGHRSEIQVVDAHAEPGLLVIDEAGERGETEWEDRMLAFLIDERYAHRRDTLLIANQRREAFLESVGPRIASRLQETGGIVLCDWPSYRSKAAVAG